MQQKDNPVALDSELTQPEIPLLSDIVLPYVELLEEDVSHFPSIDSELAAIEEDDFALESLAEDSAALAELEIEDSYNYDDSEETIPATGPVRLSVPQPDIVITAIRTALHQKLSKEMSDLISPVLEQTIEQVTEVIHNELTQKLEARISSLIQQELDKQFGKE